MSLYNRRDFLKMSSMAAFMLTADPLDFKKDTPLLSFSTIGCPDWPMDKIVDFAYQNQFNGIEIRGIQKELDLPKLEIFSTKDKIASFNKQLKKKKLKIINLGSSAAMHLPEGEERDKNLDEAKRFILLAQQLNCPFVRVFPNRFPENQSREETVNLMVSGLQELGDYAKKNGKITILLETHGDLSKSADVAMIMEKVNHPQVAIVWDVVNMWSETQEAPVEVYGRLKNYIRHIHIKDYVLTDGKIHYVHVGKGITPIFDAIDLLRKNGYKGYYSFEWEKLWHPDIGDSAEAFEAFDKVMREHFRM